MRQGTKTVYAGQEKLMPFTDDDLKRLKELNAVLDPALDSWRSVHIQALIARLEESEKLLPPEALEDCGEPGCGDCAVYRPWRKAAGK
jgi:hypothetical protein